MFAQARESALQTTLATVRVQLSENKALVEARRRNEEKLCAPLLPTASTACTVSSHCGPNYRTKCRPEKSNAYQKSSNG